MTTNSHGSSASRLAGAFYATAATGAVIGQTWVAVKHVPLPVPHPMVAALVVLPFAACLELLGMATAALADQRQRAGERAVGFRVLSMLVAALAVLIILVGHWDHLYVALGFGVFSASAYLLWLLHSAARRRDALRAAGMLSRPTPVYGWRWLASPLLVARAREVALLEGLDLVDSLNRARKLREEERADREAEQRRRRIARAVRRLVRSEHHDRGKAELAALVLDLSRIAADLQASADYDWWRDRLAAELGLSSPPTPTEPDAGSTESAENSPTVPDVRPARRSGRSRAAKGTRKATTRDRVAQLAAKDMSKEKIADRLGVTVRTVERNWPEPSLNGSGATDG